jgi:hypothetical protein
MQFQYIRSVADMHSATSVDAVFCGGYMDLVINESNLKLVQPEPMEVLLFKPQTAMKELFAEQSMDLTDEQRDAHDRFSFISHTPWSAVQGIRPSNRVKIIADSMSGSHGTVVLVETNTAVLDIQDSGHVPIRLRDIRLDFVMGDIAEVPASLQLTHDPLQDWQDGIVLGVIQDELSLLLRNDQVVSRDVSLPTTSFILMPFRYK